MKRFQTCCLCCSLETGAYVLSALGVLASFLTIILSSLMFEKANESDVSEDVLIFRIVACCVSIFLYALLMVGTLKRNSCLILPYLIIAFIGIVMQFVLFILVVISSLDIARDRMMGFYIGYPIGITIAVYIWMCMLSLYMKIRDENSNKSYTRHTEDSFASGKKYIV